ncbi:DUF2190 family protein [Pseudogemmobacter faecipullorum]|uniref:DUF2190 family protein n=1 Tax=Pseudogemmobacter faecipullorum TaxID=2755041 RepID=A0ABS8CSH7_9RHOB|nr:capsid cement protein [Pseudogemmobacter faecipullorum]MCB5412352.1 DUF2190 family protein [Pseudogemmobacter faecipullorum]
MAKNFIQRGWTVSVPAPRDVLSGELVVVGVLAGVAQHDAASGTPVEINTEGVFALKKTSAQAWTVGAAIYATPSTGICGTAATAGNLLVGVAIEAAANPSETGVVRLNGSAPAAVAA